VAEIPSAPAFVKALRPLDGALSRLTLASAARAGTLATRGLDRRPRCGWLLVMRRLSSSHLRGTCESGGGAGARIVLNLESLGGG